MERDVEEDVELNIDDNWDGDTKRKHKSRKPMSVDEADGLDSSGRKRMSERHESRKRLGGSNKADSDQDDREGRKESRSKQAKKFSEDNDLDKSSTWYQDEESEKRLEGDEKSGCRGYIRAEESERKKASSKYSDHGASMEKVLEKDLRNSDRRDDGKEKGHRHAEHGRSSRKRHDDSDNVGKGDDYTEKSNARIGNPSDSKLESARARSGTLEYQSSETKGRGFESPNGKGYDRDQRKGDSERSKRGRSESLVEESKGSSARNDISGKERSEDNTQPRNPTRDTVDGSGKSVAADEDVGVSMRDKTTRDVESASSVRTPEKIVKRLYDSDNVEMDHGRSSSSFRRKEHGKDGSWDDRSKERDDRNRDQENSKETWKRKQDRESREGETTYENSRDWDLLRRTRDTRDRIDAERPHGRVGPFGGRKDGNRTEAVKTSSKYGISTENYDVIEIQTKPFDYGRDDSRSNTATSIDVAQQSDSKMATEVEEFPSLREDRSRSRHGSVQSGEDAKDRMHGDISMHDPRSWKDDNDFQAEKPRGFESNRGGQISGSGPLPPYGNQDSGSYRTAPPSGRGNKFGRVVRGRTPGRESQQAGMPIPFGPLGLAPPGPMQPLPPNMSPAPGPPISPGVFMPPFPPPMLWPGARGLEMNMFAIPQGLPPLPLGPRFPPNLGNPPNGSIFSPSGPVRGMPPNLSVPNFPTIVPTVRGPSQDKASGGWVPPPRNNGPPGKAPSRGEQNDYSQNFVDTGMRPQNFIRELELTSVVEDYPKLRELIQRKDEIVANSATPPMYYKCDLREQALSPEFFGTKFDVILVDPPWEEYVHRAPGVTDHMEHWTFEEIMNLKIEAIADTPSFIFLWVGDGVGLEQGRLCLKKWGFRRCEDICWVKTNKTTATPGLRHDSHTLYQRTKEHCLMGIKGTVRRSTDGHIIHANIDTDVIIAEEPPYGSTAKPEDMYRIVEHFALGRRRLELFGEDHNIRSGWLTVGKGLTSSNFNSEGYIRNFADKDGKVWQGGNGRNPPPEAPHLALTTPEIESLRPKSPMKNQLQMQQQQQQQSAVISLTTPSSGNKRTTGNSPNHNGPMGPESSSSNMPSPAPWASSPMIRDGMSDDRLDLYAYNAQFGPPSGDFMDYETHRGMNMF